MYRLSSFLSVRLPTAHVNVVFSLCGYTRARVFTCVCVCACVCVCTRARVRVCVYTVRDVPLCGTSSYTLPGIIDPLVYCGHASPDTIAHSRRCARVRSLTPFSLSRDTRARARIAVRLCFRRQNRFNGAMCEHDLFVIHVGLKTNRISCLYCKSGFRE